MTSSYVMWPLTKNIYIHMYFDKKYVCSDISHILRWDRNHKSEARTSWFGQSEVCQMSCGHSLYWISISCHIFYRGSPFVRTRSQVVTNIQYSNNWGRRFLLICRRSTLGQMFKNIHALTRISVKLKKKRKYVWNCIVYAFIYGFSFSFVYKILGLK